MKNILIISSLILVLTNCFSYKAESYVCKDLLLTNNLISGKKEGKSIPKVELKLTKDISNELLKFEDYGNVLINFDFIKLYNQSGDLKWISKLDIFISGTTPNYPKILIYKQYYSSLDNEMDIKIIVPSHILYKYLSQGEIIIYYSLEGEVPKELSLGIKFCVDVSVSDTKSIF